MDKAPDAFRTISEVADDLDIPQHVLRFWETRFTQIKPMKRSGGRRYYRPDDVDLLRGIRRLLYGEGYTIRGVQRILKENGIKAVQGLDEGAPAPGFAPVRAPAADPAPTPRPVAKRPVVTEEPAEEPEIEAEFDEDDVADEDETLEGDDTAEEPEDVADDDEAEEEEDTEEVPAPVAARQAPDIVPRREPDLRPAAPQVSVQPPAPRTEPVMSRANPVPPPRANPAPVPRAETPAPRPVRSLDRDRLEAVLEELLAARRAIDAAMKDGN